MKDELFLAHLMEGLQWTLDGNTTLAFVANGSVGNATGRIECVLLSVHPYPRPSPLALDDKACNEADARPALPRPRPSRPRPRPTRPPRPRPRQAAARRPARPSALSRGAASAVPCSPAPFSRWARTSDQWGVCSTGRGGTADARRAPHGPSRSLLPLGISLGSAPILSFVPRSTSALSAGSARRKVARREVFVVVARKGHGDRAQATARSSVSGRPVTVLQLVPPPPEPRRPLLALPHQSQQLHPASSGHPG